MKQNSNKNGVNICHICSNYDKFYIDFMEEQLLKVSTLKVFYFRAKERGLPDVKASYLDVRLNYSNWNRPFFLLKEHKILKDFMKLYKNSAFDILHAHTLFSNGYIAMRAKQKFGIPYIVAVRDMDVNIFFKYRINLRRLGLRILDNADGVVFISRSYKEEVMNKYIPKYLKSGIDKKSSIIPNGINPFYLDNIYRRKDSPNPNKITIITVGYVSKR
ncbi:glycosyltransferase, partial [Alkalibacterium sp. 20]|uniref:glycosyltransferase n=1 Tax=Alkalibacterium sp. 20 TaxID=1798803 RepID=UPI000A64885B